MSHLPHLSTLPIEELRQARQKIPASAPFGWIGGKSKLAPKIVQRFPSHTTYVEVFGGALHLLYRKPRSKVEVINDINSDLINLHRTIRNHPQTLALCLSDLFFSREIFEEIKTHRLLPRNPIEQAAFYYYRLSTSFGAKGVNFAMPKSGRTPKNIYRSFKVWSDRLKGVCIENLDFERLINHYDTPETLFYLDPPYVGTESYYKLKDGFSLEAHERLARILHEIKGKFILSYNDCPLVRELYASFLIEEVETTYSLNGASCKKGAEVLIRNF